MTELDVAPGNANGEVAEAAMRTIHTDPLFSGRFIHFRFYMEAPRIVDWLKEYGIDAHYEQRKNEGVSIVLPNCRAFVGNYILLSDDQVRIV